ncbi:hypothetical protein EV646_102536 [Kribbella antiqua]|uniref:DUF2255 family protein n=1 Tax=Kribbella antiqua TaxID=2512217 RepID=A0A4R2IZR6_9ACTN|nr:DUF2255 family protein [Kribbella antiqua]TCO50462.1 hypothetical protein EV646_102536 [Kribbella antiqua]
MTAWTADELQRIGDATQLRVSSLRKDGSLRPYVTIWVVRVGDDIYIRSAHGADNPWFRRAKTSGKGRIKAGGVERDVTFAPASPGTHQAIDTAYHTKYDRYGRAIVATVVGENAMTTTLQLVPRD